MEANQEQEHAPQEQSQKDIVQEQNIQQSTEARESHPFSVSDETDAGMKEAADEVERNSPSKPDEAEKQSPPSDISSPGRAVIRKKSSLNLASLPPRDPLIKKSIGTQSQNNIRDSSRGFSAVRDSFLNRGKHSQGANITRTTGLNDGQLDTDDEMQTQTSTQSESINLQSKTSTQRLHERITMLGQSASSRPSKSIPTAAANARRLEPSESTHIPPDPKQYPANDEGDGITSITEQSTADLPASHDPDTQNNKPYDLHQTTTSTRALYPELGAYVDSNTPAGSPSKWAMDGPLSASKAKFQNFLRSAKGMFASSAAASAQAKMEAFSPSPSRPKLDRQPASIDDVLSYKTSTVQQSEALLRKRSMSDGPGEDAVSTAVDEPPPKRRSSKRVSEQLAKRVADASAESVEHKSPVDSSQPRPAEKAMLDTRGNMDCVPGSETSQTTKTVTKKAIKTTNISKNGEARHPKQVAKTNTAQKSKPGQFSVTVPSMRPQLNASTGPVRPVSQQQLSSSTSSSRPPLTKKGSESSMRTVSSQSNRPGTANSKVKALENARRKKEQDEREQQRKEEQKKALERKRAEKAEEERQANERKLDEQRREAEARATAQKRALEAQKAEKAQREEQLRIQAEKAQREERLRVQAEAAKAKQAKEEFSKSQHERPQAATASKTEKVPLRSESREPDSSRPLVPHVNPAKPPKRYFNPDADELSQPSALPMQNQASTQQTSTQQAPKKQKVSEDLDHRTQQQPLPRPPMGGAPVRASVAKKQELPSKFHQGYMSNVSAAQAGPSSMLKSAINTSHQMQQSSYHPKTPHSIQDIAKFANQRIPFAEAPNPPGQPSYHQQPPRTTQKTPGFGKTPAKSSPGYPNGDNISLPDIATDSEDEDSEDGDGFQAPAWTNSPELRHLLEQQQLVDPMKVFGPIAPLSMEEVFKGASKDRMRRFRDRTSSANWNGPDRLTEEERRKDKEARERLERDGGWTYDGSLEIDKPKR